MTWIRAEIAGARALPYLLNFITPAGQGFVFYDQRKFDIFISPTSQKRLKSSATAIAASNS